MGEIDLSPRAFPAAVKPVLSFLRDVSGSPIDDAADIEAQIEFIRRRHLKNERGWNQSDRHVTAALINLFADLAKQGWRFRARGRWIRGLPPGSDQEDNERPAKRRRLIARRNEQLREPATREFIARMERGHYHAGHRTSVFSLMRDGRDLAAALEGVVANGNTRLAIEEAIRPYLQFVAPNRTCEHTGFSLQDIWRYFRHTWSNPYESIPGRSILFLVRDAAAGHHPVMGIGAISSAAMQLEGRDRYIGWHGEEFLAQCLGSPEDRVANWVVFVIERAISQIYQTDLIADELLPYSLPAQVSKTAIARLRALAKRERLAHHRRSASKEHKGEPPTDISDENWEARARSPLFRSKRAAELASLFSLRNVVQKHYGNFSGVGRLSNLLSSKVGRSAFVKVVRIARSFTIGTAIADLNVCGGIPPYNEILGGKLTAMLAVSPEVITEYRRKYASTPSVIASSMAGKRIIRPANLVFLGTTSLYGMRPNQYDRIAIPCKLLGDKGISFVRYQQMDDRTIGVGTFQFSKATKATLESFMVSTRNGRRVNNVFGEGTNPKLRAIRDGLAQLGFDPEQLLQHGLRKTVYGAALVSNLRDYLLGFSDVPAYKFCIESPTAGTQAISQFWLQRWVASRIKRADVLYRIKCQTLVHPIRHSARVQLPDADLEQLSLRSEAYAPTPK